MTGYVKNLRRKLMSVEFTSNTAVSNDVTPAIDEDLLKRDGERDGQHLKDNGEKVDFADVDFLAMRQVLHGLNAVRKGNFSVRLPGDWTGLEGKIADVFNEIVAANE